MEAAADVIAHAAERHRAQREEHHVARALDDGAACRACSRSRNSSSLGRGNFGALPNPPRRASNAAANSAVARSSTAGGGTSPAAALRPERAQPLDDVRGGLGDLVALFPPDARDLLEDVGEPGLAPPAGRRKVGAAVERLQRRREPHAHRPAARPGRRLHEGHVDAVDVGPLLAIDLDRDEVLVQQLRELGVLEALVLHDVAPVTRRVADRQKDRLVLLRARAQTPRRPTDTSRPGCLCAEGDRDLLRRRDDSAHGRLCQLRTTAAQTPRRGDAEIWTSELELEPSRRRDSAAVLLCASCSTRSPESSRLRLSVITAVARLTPALRSARPVGPEMPESPRSDASRLRPPLIEEFPSSSRPAASGTARIHPASVPAAAAMDLQANSIRTPSRRPTEPDYRADVAHPDLPDRLRHRRRHPPRARRKSIHADAA